MATWTIPQSTIAPRGFHGLTGYYCRFIWDYSIVAEPLVQLLQKNAFVWSDKAQSTFRAPQAALMSAPVLHHPDFSLDFHIECDASDLRPISFAPALLAIFIPTVDLLSAIRREIHSSFALKELLRRREEGLLPAPWNNREGLMLYKERVYLNTASPLIPRILLELHSHEGVHRTLQRIRAEFYWKGFRSHVQSLIAACTTCQKNTADHLLPAGLLQPLPVPCQVWADISMDFVEDLPSVRGKSVLMAVFDGFSKGAHFIALNRPLLAEHVARVFFQEVFRLHDMPESIVSDCDTVFTSKLWRELFSLSDTKLSISSAYHPQLNG